MIRTGRGFKSRTINSDPSQIPPLSAVALVPLKHGRAAQYILGPPLPRLSIQSKKYIQRCRADGHIQIGHNRNLLCIDTLLKLARGVRQDLNIIDS